MYNRLEKQVLRLIGENLDAPDVFIDQADAMRPIRESLTAAMQEIIMLTGCYRERCLVPLVADQQWYRVRWDRGWLGYVTDAWTVNNSRRLEMVDFVRANWLDPRWRLNRGTPDAYWQIGFDIIAVTPKPSATDDVLDLWCVVIPDQYEDGVEIHKIREEWEWATVHYAVGEYYASRGDANEAIIHQQAYMDRLGKAVGQPMSAETRRQFITFKEPWPTATSRRPWP